MSQETKFTFFLNMLSFNFIDIASIKIERVKLKSFIKQLVHKEGFLLGDLSFNFCSDDHILLVNIEYLKHDYFTDIITFDYSEGENISGDLIISLDRVKENAKELFVSFDDEFLRVCFHGVLHLCGYNDKSKVEKDLMTVKENCYLSMYSTFVPRGTK